MIRKISIIVIALVASASAFADVSGVCIAGPATYSAADHKIHTVADGNLWANNAVTFFKVSLVVDGTLIWANGPTFRGQNLPTIWPGFAFGYTQEFSMVLTPGTHTITWAGSITPVSNNQPNPPGKFLYVTTVVVP